MRTDPQSPLAPGSDGEPAAAARRPLVDRPFAALLVAQASFGYSFSAFFLLPKFLAAELDAGAEAIGLVSATHGVAAMLSMLAMWVMVDRLGRRPFLLGGAALMAAPPSRSPRSTRSDRWSSRCERSRGSPSRWPSWEARPSRSTWPRRSG